MLPKPGKNPMFPKNLCLISLLSTRSRLFEKVIPKIVQGTLKKEAHLMQASLVSMPVTAGHFNMRFTDHVTLNFNSIMSTAEVFLNIEKAFDTTWHLDLLYKLSNLKFSINQAY
jgi:hypothetical protein